MTYFSYVLGNPGKNEKVWNFDTVICAFFLFTTFYFILDVLARQTLGSTQFQIEWIFLIIANLRLVMIPIFQGRSCEKDALKRAIKLFIPIVVVVVYTTALSFLQQDFLSQHGLYFGAISDNFIIRRGAKYIGYLGLSLYFASVVNTWKKFYSVILFLIYSLCIAEIAGFIQSIIYASSGVDILPITRTLDTGFIEISATVDFLGIKFLRINSLAHEPKELAGAMFILFLFKFYAEPFLNKAKQYIHLNTIFENYLKKSWFFTLIVLFLTFSGSGIIVLTIILAIIISFQIWRLFILGKPVQQGKIISILATGIILLLLFNTNYIISFLDVSILRRIPTLFNQGVLIPVEELGLDPEDAAAIIQIKRYPNVALYGIGFGGFSNLTLPLIVNFYRITIETASSFSRNLFIECLFSSGLVGLCAIFIFAINLFKKASLDPFNYAILMLVIGSYFMLRGSDQIFFTFIGLSASLNYLNSRGQT